MRATVRRLTGGLVLAVALTGVLTATPSSAADGSPPVTGDDEVTMFPGQFVELDLLANDSDPDGDELAICRFGKLPRHLHIEGDGDSMWVAAKPRARGTYTFTYNACDYDYDYLTPATVTVTIERAPQIQVRKMSERPGRLRVRNTATFRIFFVYGSRAEDEPDGVVRIRRKTTKIVSVHRTRIFWFAVARNSGELVDHGLVRNIEVPRSTKASVEAPKPTSRQLDAWRELVRR